MHILVVADGRSPHTAGWVRGMASLGIRTTLQSSHVLDATCRANLEAVIGPAAVHEPEDTWSRMRPRLALGSPNRRSRRAPTAPDGGTAVRLSRPGPAFRLLHEIELHTSVRLTTRLESLIQAVRPDAVHALRIQFEGIAATGSRAGLPIAVSTWGSDLIYTARATGRLVRRTSQALRRVDLLMGDCQRDVELAHSWGLRREAARYVIPGNFGIDLAGFPERDPELTGRLQVEDRPLVVYPRGVRGVVNHQGFIHAARRLLAEQVDASFVGVGLSPIFGGRTDIPGRLVCTGNLDNRTMLTLAACSAVTVSPSFSDGTPASVLEGMAGGAIPVCGDLASLRELERRGAIIAWCQPGDPESIASAIRSALRLSTDPGNRARNHAVVANHYSTSSCTERARSAYQDLLKAR